MDREKGREQAKRSIETCISRKWESSGQDRSSPRLSAAHFQYHARTVNSCNWDRQFIGSLILNFCFQMHVRLLRHIENSCSLETCLHSCADIAFARGNYKKNLQQSHVFTALCRNSEFFDMICMYVFVCEYVCLIRRMSVGPISCYLHDNGADRHSFQIPKPRPKAT